MRTPMDILNKAASAAPDAKLIFYQDETALNAQIAMGFDAEEDNNPNISYLELHSLANVSCPTTNWSPYCLLSHFIYLEMLTRE